MPGLLPDIDPDGLLEYSVVYTDRAVNHMSQAFQQTMRDISSTLAEVYHAEAVAIVPGSGTYGMEAVARQLATDVKVFLMILLPSFIKVAAVMVRTSSTKKILPRLKNLSND